MSTTSQNSASSRISALLDDNSFVEIGGSVTARNTDFNLQNKETPADGVLTGYGTIDGALVYVYSQDATVLGGSIGEMHAKKISAARAGVAADESGVGLCGAVRVDPHRAGSFRAGADRVRDHVRGHPPVAAAGAENGRLSLPYSFQLALREIPAELFRTYSGNISGSVII